MSASGTSCPSQSLSLFPHTLENLPLACAVAVDVLSTLAMMDFARGSVAASVLQRLVGVREGLREAPGTVGGSGQRTDGGSSAVSVLGFLVRECVAVVSRSGPAVSLLCRRLPGPALWVLQSGEHNRRNSGGC